MFLRRESCAKSYEMTAKQNARTFDIITLAFVLLAVFLVGEAIIAISIW